MKSDRVRKRRNAKEKVKKFTFDLENDTCVNDDLDQDNDKQQMLLGNKSEFTLLLKGLTSTIYFSISLTCTGNEKPLAQNWFLF